MRIIPLTRKRTFKPRSSSYRIVGELALRKIVTSHVGCYVIPISRACFAGAERNTRANVVAIRLWVIFLGHWLESPNLAGVAVSKIENRMATDLPCFHLILLILVGSNLRLYFEREI